MGKIVSYGTGTNKYDFTNSAVYQERITSNFGNMVRTAQRMVMSSGGFDRYGVSKGPHEVGTVKLQMTLRSTTRNGMEALRDNIRTIERYGLVPLIYQPTDATESERFCYARVTSMQMPQQPSQHTDLHQQVSVDWEVPNPIWHTTPNTGPVWGLFEWGDGSLWGGTPVTINAAGALTDGTATNNGTAPALAVITVATGAGQTCQNPTIQRIVNGTAVDQVSYTGALGNSQTLIINARKRSVTLDGANAFTSLFDFTHPNWMRILPGDNTIRVVFAGGGDAATVTISYFDNFYGA